MRMTKLLRNLQKRLVSAADRMIGPQRIHMLHIGKTGGTAAWFALQSAALPANVRLLKHRHGVKLPDIPAGESVLFFVRDPITRFISGFYSRQRKGQPRYYFEWSEDEATAFAEFSSPGELAESLTTDRRQTAVAAFHSIQHVSDSYWGWFVNEDYFLERLDDIYFVGAQEQLSEDMTRLQRVLGIPGDLLLPESDVQAHRNPSHLDYELSEAAVFNLREWYADDYRFLELVRSKFPYLPSYG